MHPDSPFAKTDNPTTPPPAPPAEPVIEERVDKLVLTLVRTTYVNGRPVAEKTAEPIVLFRAAVPDVWTFADKALANGSGPNPRS